MYVFARHDKMPGRDAELLLALHAYERSGVTASQSMIRADIRREIFAWISSVTQRDEATDCGVLTMHTAASLFDTCTSVQPTTSSKMWIIAAACLFVAA